MASFALLTFIVLI